MKTYIPRLALGAIFVTAGLNGFFSFLPDMGMSNAGTAFIESLKESGFVWALINTVEVVAGSLLLFNVMGQLAVLLLAPICLGIFLFHTMYSIEGSTLAWIAIGLEVTMIAIWRENFAAMFKEFNKDGQKNDYEHSPMGFTSGGHHSRDGGFASDFSLHNEGAGIKQVNRKQEGEMVADRPSYKDSNPRAEA